MERRTGRPTGLEQKRRQRLLLALLADGKPLVAAARQVGMRPETVLRTIDSEPAFRMAVFGLLQAAA